MGYTISAYVHTSLTDCKIIFFPLETKKAQSYLLCFKPRKVKNEFCLIKKLLFLPSSVDLQRERCILHYNAKIKLNLFKFRN